MGYDEMVYGLLAPHLNGGQVLSVGCGMGKAEALLQKYTGVQVMGVEVTTYKEAHIPITPYDGNRLPFSNKSFDTTLFVYMLHHTTDIPHFLKEAKRVTKKEILILDHSYSNILSKGLLGLYDYCSNVLFDIPIPLNFLKVKEWHELFRTLDLQVKEASVPSALNVFFKLRVRS